MKETRILMGMPVTIEIVDPQVTDKNLGDIFAYFEHIDKKFSTYKDSSEISKINQGKIEPDSYSSELQEVLLLSEETKKQTDGYFDIRTPQGFLDPSGLVKGWAIWNAARKLTAAGFSNFYVEAGGDVQVSGVNNAGQPWSVGIKNPFQTDEIVKVVYLKNSGLATSGTYLRGQHIYNPKTKEQNIAEIVSLTVIGPNVYEADRFATAAFAMGKQGINFIDQIDSLEGYIIDRDGVATMTSGFEDFTKLT
jgi:thiamine biosynthesis lipoprotein